MNKCNCKCENNGQKEYKLSPKGMAAITMALLKSLAEECDIVKILGDFKLIETKEGLEVVNPPTVMIDKGRLVREDEE